LGVTSAPVAAAAAAAVPKTPIRPRGHSSSCRCLLQTDKQKQRGIVANAGQCQVLCALLGFNSTAGSASNQLHCEVTFALLGTSRRCLLQAATAVAEVCS
jgi:hypothetical protein